MFQFFKKMRKKWNQAVDEAINQWNGSLEEMKIQPELKENIAACQRIFADMDIVRYKTVQADGKGTRKYFLTFCDGMVDSNIINDNIIKPLITHPPIAPAKGESMMETLLSSVLQVGEAKTTDNYKEVVEAVTSGDTAMFIEGCNQAAILNTKKYLLRSTSEPENEKVLIGPREGFNESLIQNLSQVTRRLRTSELKTKMLTLGRRTQTPVCVCYLDGIVDKSILNDLMQRLNKIDIDGVLDINYISELIRDCKTSTFRTTGYTERPDIVVSKLLEGRIAIFADGTPTVLTVPYLFIENFQSNEDYYFVYYYGTFARLIRMAGFALTVMVPGLYIAAVAFHQEMLPLQLLMRIALERRSVPLSASLEALIMLLVFDILRETGVRMPTSIGQPLSIVGALVIGQAAVQARLVAAPMIIMVAFTGITGLLVPKLNSPIIYWRLLLLILASLFGYFGLAIGISLMITHIQNLTSMGVEQTSLTGNLRLQDMKDIFVRAPWGMMKQRPSHLTQNINREAGGPAMAKRLTACLLIFALLLPLGGCWNYRSLDEVNLVVGLSIDYDKKRNLFLTGYEIANLAGGEEMSPISGKMVYSEGKTLFDAARNSKRRETDRMFFGNTEVVVIDQEVAHDLGVIGIVEWFLRDGEMRENMAIAISQEDSASKILAGGEDMKVIMSSVLADIIREDPKVTATTYPMQLYEIYDSLYSPRRSALIPAVHMVKNGKDEIPELNGTGVIKGDRLVGYLSPEQSRYVLMVENKLKSGILTLSTSDVVPIDDLSLEIFLNKAKKSYTYENGQFTFKIQTDTYVAIAENHARLDTSEQEVFLLVEADAERIIKDNIEELMSVLQHQLHADVLGFGEMVSKKDHKLWREIEASWEDIFPTVKVEVFSKVRVLNSAFMI